VDESGRFGTAAGRRTIAEHAFASLCPRFGDEMPANAAERLLEGGESFVLCGN
jgi:hypothetical protein